MTRIFISRDSGALCVGAEAVAKKFRDEAKDRGLDVEIVRTGSRGMYWLEPLIEEIFGEISAETNSSGH